MILGLALALCVAAILTFPFAAVRLGELTLALVGRLCAMALLGVVLGFALELAALRRLPASHVAVLFSLLVAAAPFACALGEGSECWLSCGAQR